MFTKLSTCLVMAVVTIVSFLNSFSQPEDPVEMLTDQQRQEVALEWISNHTDVTVVIEKKDKLVEVPVDVGFEEDRLSVDLDSVRDYIKNNVRFGSIVSKKVPDIAVVLRGDKVYAQLEKAKGETK